MRALPWMLVLAVVVAGCQSAGEPAPSPQAPTAAPAEPPVAAPSSAPPVSAAPKPPEPPPPPPPSMSVGDMQKRLTELGYKPGPADGKMGPRTAAALKRFQHDRKLAQTGTLDAETIVELLKPKP